MKTTPKTKKMVIIKGKGTKNEQRIETDIDMYWSEAFQRWMTIPPKESREERQ